jgi:threonine synthase
LAVINAAGADTFYQLVERRGVRWENGAYPKKVIADYYREVQEQGRRAATVASAIEISRPVNLPKALRALAICGGVVRPVTDAEILDAKAKVGTGGLGCEPASAASVAGVRKLRQEGVIAKDELVVCILTGHALKDPAATVGYHEAGRGTFANRPLVVGNDAAEIIRMIETQGLSRKQT